MMVSQTGHLKPPINFQKEGGEPEEVSDLSQIVKQHKQKLEISQNLISANKKLLNEYRALFQQTFSDM